jgi:hypothetical protein
MTNSDIAGLRDALRPFYYEARRLGLLLPSGPDRDCYSYCNTGLSNRDIRVAAILFKQLEARASTPPHLGV